MMGVITDVVGVLHYVLNLKNDGLSVIKALSEYLFHFDVS